MLLEINKNDFNWIFDYNTDRNPKYNTSPLQMIKNLHLNRHSKISEFISEQNDAVEKMSENQRSVLNMLVERV